MHGNFLPEIRERVSDSFVISLFQPLRGKQVLNTANTGYLAKITTTVEFPV